MKTEEHKNMEPVLFKPLKVPSEILDNECGEPAFLSAYKLLQNLFPHINDYEPRTIARQYVLDHPIEIDNAQKQAVEFFTFCTESIQVYKETHREVKECVLKTWLILLHYFSLPKGKTVLTGFLLRVAIEDSLLEFQQIVKDVVIENFKSIDQAESVYQDYILLAIMAMIAERKGDVEELKDIFNFIIERIVEVTTNDKLKEMYDAPLKVEEGWVEVPNKPKVQSSYFGTSKLSFWLSNPPEKPVLTLKYVALYYAAKILKVLGRFKVNVDLFKALKALNGIAGECIGKLKLLRGLLKESTSRVETLCAMCQEYPKKFHAAFLYELLKLTKMSFLEAKLVAKIGGSQKLFEKEQRLVSRGKHIERFISTMKEFKY